MVFGRDLDRALFGSVPSDADSFICVSGYISPYAADRCVASGLPSTIVYGMFSRDGVLRNDHEFYKRAVGANPDLEIKYSSSVEIHTKCFVWFRGQNVVRAVGGSANFTWRGLNSPGRELLIEISAADFPVIKALVDAARNTAVACTSSGLEGWVYEKPAPVRRSGSIGGGTTEVVEEWSIELSLLTRKGTVPPASGINWGFANANVRRNDAYIRIPNAAVRGNPGFFPPKVLGANEPVELLWDDGVTMAAFLEASQDIDGVVFPKQIASHPNKDTLGRYLRHRMGVADDAFVTWDDFTRYGRTSVKMTYVSEGRYLMDFSS